MNGIVPSEYKMMSHKQNSAGGLENISSVQVRMFPEKRIDKSVQQEKFIKTQSFERSGTLTSDQKIELSVLINSMKTSETNELLDIVDSDWNLITPLLVKEFLWRKRNGASTKDLLQYVLAYEKLSSLPEHDLQRFIGNDVFAEPVSEKSVPEKSVSIETVPFVSKDSESVLLLKFPNEDRKYFKNN